MKVVILALKEEGFFMLIDRSQKRANRKKKRIAAAKERQLNYSNEFGISDPTPYQAIKNINMKGDKK